MEVPFDVRLLDHNKGRLRWAVINLRAINNPFCQRILSFLQENGPVTVTSIYQGLKLQQSLVSQHLAALRRIDLVEHVRDGRNIYYRANNDKISRMHRVGEKLATYNEKI